MKQKIVGVYEFGYDQVQIVLREGTGGEFWMIPEKGSLPRIKIGADCELWRQVIEVFFHEAFEIAMTRSQLRYRQHDAMGMGHDGYIFFFNHNQFTDLCSRVGELSANALPDLSRAWGKWNKKNNKSGKKSII